MVGVDRAKAEADALAPGAHCRRGALLPWQSTPGRRDHTAVSHQYARTLLHHAAWVGRTAAKTRRKTRWSTTALSSLVPRICDAPLIPYSYVSARVTPRPD